MNIPMIQSSRRNYASLSAIVCGSSSSSSSAAACSRSPFNQNLDAVLFFSDIILSFQVAFLSNSGRGWLLVSGAVELIMNSLSQQLESYRCHCLFFLSQRSLMHRFSFL